MKDLHTIKDLFVLYVEDDDMIRAEFSEILRKLFGKLLTAKNGQEALYLYKELTEKHNSIDMIISDINMPIMDGLKLLEEIRKIDSNIPFIFTTAHSQVDFLLQSISLNVSDYLIKPINVNALKSKTEILFSDIVKEKKRITKHNELSEYISILDQVAIVSKTNKEGIITYVNDFFCEVSGYTKEELIGKNHNIIRHPHNSKAFYEQMWEKLSDGNIWKGKIKNLSKSGENYFLISTIMPIYNKKETQIKEYVSVNFLTTQIELKNREFKKNVMFNFQETRRINLNSRKKIDELQNQLKSYKHIDLVKDAFEKERKKSSRLLNQVSYLEKDISNSKIKITDMTIDTNAKVSKATFLLKEEQNTNRKIIAKLELLERDMEEKIEEVLKRKDELIQKNKTIHNLRDVIAHREEEIYELKQK